MSDKYTIQNCPAIYGVSFNGCKKDHYEDGTVLCQDCTDCVMKQIVELCKEDWEDMTVSKFQSELLNKLDIQEVE